MPNPPRIDTLFLCTSFDSDGDDGGLLLKEPLHTVVAEGFPDGSLLLPEFVLYAAMTVEEADGQFDFEFHFVRGEKHVTLPNPILSAVLFESRYHPATPREEAFEFGELLLPEPGVYYLHIYCEGESLNGRPETASPAFLRVIRHEPEMT